MPVLLALRFLAELVLLAAYAVAGWTAGRHSAEGAPGLVIGLLLGVLLPLVVATMWGRWIAPRAADRLRDPRRMVVEVALFAGALVLAGASGSQAATVAGLAALAGFLISLPARRVEP